MKAETDDANNRLGPPAGRHDVTPPDPDAVRGSPCGGGPNDVDAEGGARSGTASEFTRGN